ncbi:MAG: sigma-70 family RNA polymerase sigma factor [Chloroflexota bacterium]
MGQELARRPGRGAPRGRALGGDVEAQEAVAVVFRDEAPRLIGALVGLLGDFDLAEELVQDAIVEALEHWPREGLPERPGAWLMATARRKAIDRIRRESRGREKLALLVASEAPPAAGYEPEDRLRLIFTCCHPALARDAQVALTLRAVAGLTTGQIARAFLVSESTVAQRIVRAKRKIVEAGIPYRVPEGPRLRERLDAVLAVLYLMFNEGYLSSGPDVPERRDMARDAEWLAALLVRLLPSEPEPLGLLALMRLHLARADARFDAEGQMVLLERQDRSRWDRAAIEGAGRLIQRAAAMRRPGAYQLQAAIAAVHAESPSWEETDWREIGGLYELLLSLLDTPVIRLNRAIALRWVVGPEAALAELDAIAPELDGYHLLHATRGVMLRALGQADAAAAAERRALGLTSNPAERSLIERRLAGDG